MLLNFLLLGCWLTEYFTPDDAAGAVRGTTIRTLLERTQVARAAIRRRDIVDILLVLWVGGCRCVQIIESTRDIEPA